MSSPFKNGELGTRKSEQLHCETFVLICANELLKIAMGLAYQCSYFQFFFIVLVFIFIAPHLGLRLGQNFVLADLSL